MSLTWQDAERLEELELNATSAAVDLEWLLEQSMELTLKIMAGREKLQKAVLARDTFKAALEGVGVKL